MKEVLYFLTGLAAGLLIGANAKAHDDADWIQKNPAYIDKSGRHCCGPVDCQVMPLTKKAIRLPDGWEIEGIFFQDGSRGLYESTDEKIWWCIGVHDYDPLKGKAKCLFMPEAKG